MEYGLPKRLEIGGEMYSVRYDFRVILDIFEVLNDPELNDQDRAIAVLQMFYIDFDKITDYEEAVKKLFWFINCGQEEEPTAKKQKPLVDWEQDFQYIIAPVNRALGQEIRSIEYDLKTNTGGVHWWTFISGYIEIGDCFFSQVVRIRDKKAKGKQLDKSDREFYRKNRDVIDIKTHYTEAENDLVKMWTGGGSNG